MKKLILISALLLVASNGWAKEQGLECVRHAQIGDTTFTFYNDYIINEDERYILIYPTYADSNVVKYPPETSFKKHPIKSSPEAAINAAKQASVAIEKVDEMQRSGFGSSDANILRDLVAELEQLEHEDDELEAALRNDFFVIEKEFSPIDVMFLYDVINRIGSLADIAQTVGHILIRLVSK